jgi:hypothetical protein
MNPDLGAHPIHLRDVRLPLQKPSRDDGVEIGFAVSLGLVWRFVI